MATAKLLVNLSSSDSDSVSSTSVWQDITDLQASSITVAGTGSILILMCHLGLTPDEDVGARVRFTIDGSPVGLEKFIFTCDASPTLADHFSFCYAVTGISAGTHSFGVEWIKQVGSGNPTLPTDTVYTFQVLELTGDATLITDLAVTNDVTLGGSFANITGLVESETLNSSNLYIFLLNIQPQPAGAIADAGIRFAIGGTRDGPEGQVYVRGGSNESSSLAMMWLTTGQSGSVDLSVQGVNRTGTMNLGTTYTKYFQVIEVSADFDLLTDSALTSTPSLSSSEGNITGFTDSKDIDSANSVALIVSVLMLGATAGKAGTVGTAYGGTKEGPWTDISQVFANAGCSACMMWAKTGISSTQTPSIRGIEVVATATFDAREKSFQFLDLKAAAAAPAALRPATLPLLGVQ